MRTSNRDSLKGTGQEVNAHRAPRSNSPAVSRIVVNLVNRVIAFYDTNVAGSNTVSKHL